MITSQPITNDRWQRSERYINREHSWLEFNQRVLEEAENPANPTLERLKFLAIFESNLDEFFMVRVSGLMEQVDAGITTLTPDGLTPSEQVEMIAEEVLPLRLRAAGLWEKSLKGELEKSNIHIRTWDFLTDTQRKNLRELFAKQIFPIATPLILYPNPSVPFVSNRSLNLAVMLEDEDGTQKLGRVKVPSISPRLIQLVKSRQEYILLEDVVAANLEALYPGVKILGAFRFRVVRDADVEIKELEAADLLSAIEGALRERKFGDVISLEVESGTPKKVQKLLQDLLEVSPEYVFEITGMIGLDGLSQLTRIDKSSLKNASHKPYLNENLANPKAIFETIRKQDVLLHHPFDSFTPVEQFIASAAEDPDVIGIKQTLYRVGAQSPIVESLLAAAEKGKQVAVMVELKARFDETNNILWARALERAGVHVSFGFPEMKVHCKLCSVVRKESDGMRTYAHIGTGNYNPATSRLYTDLGLLTCDPQITQDVSELFNYLTGFSKQTEYRKLLVAPHTLRDKIIDRIEREISFHKKNGNGRIIIKLNSLVDPETIESLYEASNAGVNIDLIIRGISCIRPGVPGMSENIRVRSVVGRFLEHSRIYYFGNNGKPEALIGSSDLMRRNLDRRIEVLVPITGPALVSLIHDQLLTAYMKDNTNSWIEHPDGSYQRVHSTASEFTAQRFLMGQPLTKLQFALDR